MNFPAITGGCTKATHPFSTVQLLEEKAQNLRPEAEPAHPPHQLIWNRRLNGKMGALVIATEPVHVLGGCMKYLEAENAPSTLLASESHERIRSKAGLPPKPTSWERKVT